MADLPEKVPYHNLTILYRVKLPDPPIISKEEDEKLLYSYIREQFELSKAAHKIYSDNNKLFIGLINYYDSQFFLSYVACLNLYFYRRLRIKKNFSRIKSLFRSVIYTLRSPC